MQVKLQLTPRLKKILKVALISIGALFFTGICLAFMLRNTLLEFALKKVQHKLDSEYQTDFRVAEGSMSGFTHVMLYGLTVAPRGADTLLHLDTFECGIRFWPLLTGSVQLDEVNLAGGYLHLVRNDSNTNFSRFLRGTGKVKRDSTAKVNFAGSAYKLIKKALNQVPDDASMHRFALRVNDHDNEVVFTVSTLSLNGHVFDGLFHVQGDSLDQTWKGSGNAYPDDMKGSIALYSTDTQKVMMPYVNKRFNLKTGFDSLQLVLDEVDFAHNHLRIRGQASINHFTLQHKRIAKNTVTVNKALADFTFLLGEDFISIDSSSVFKLNDITVHPYLHYQRWPEVTFALKLNSENMQAQTFFESLPEGMFSSLQGMRCSGDLSYHLNFFMNTADPANLVFDSELDKTNFHILNYGEVNLGKMSGPFAYTPYEYGRPMRTFEVGPANPYFTPLDQVSPYLKNAVLCSEDPSFFYHRGFIMDAIRNSIATNYKEKRFKRGASTISMQLVKNIFLTRDKVLSRKFEEILITWLIENNHICSKERMFEVYLNIIEWGPNVYGIGEAAQFYFNKQPAQLTLQESIFLSSIIPRPKAFRYFFGPDGNLRPWLKGTYKNISGRMLVREWITPEDTTGLVPNVLLTGPAKTYIIVTDTLRTDTLPAEDDTQEFFDNP